MPRIWVHPRLLPRNRRLMASVRNYRRRPKRRRRRAGGSKVWTSRKNKKAVARIGRAGQHLSLRDRVKKLEISSKKHYDYMLSRPNGVPIEPLGASNGTTTNESFSQMLAIQPRQLDGTIPPVSGSTRGTERNTREGMEVFVTKIRLRGRVLGIRPSDADKTKNCVYSFTDAITGTNFEQTAEKRFLAVQSACFTRIHLLVLKDTRPSTIDPTTGQYEPNPLPTNPMNPLQGLYELEGLTTTNSLESLGLDSSLRNYTNNRFKVVHSETIQTSYLYPSKWFEININVNRKVTFKAPDPSMTPQGNTDPVNMNYLFYVSSVPAEVDHAGSAQFTMNDVSVDPYVPVQLLQQPNLQMLSSRTYFTES